MDILIAVALSMALLLFSVFNGLFLGYPLSISLLFFAALLKRRHFSWREIASMAYEGSKRGVLVVQTFVLIGALTAGLMASGTMASLILLALNMVQPHLFILSAFWLCCLVSIALGSSFGTCGTVGIVLIVLARSGGIDPGLVAGAIISGIYLGDRASPMSSALNLLSALTQTDHYRNVRMTLRTSLAPFLASSLLFALFSLTNPLQVLGQDFSEQLQNAFRTGFVPLLPAIVIFILCLARISVKRAMGASIIAACLVAIFYQGVAPQQLFYQLIFGFSLPADHALAQLIKGGGILSMLRTAYIIMVATAITGLFSHGGLLQTLRPLVAQARSRLQLYGNTLAVAVLTAACGCNQAISIVMTTEMMRPVYQDFGLDPEELSHDISLTSFLVAPIIPWNIAVLVPLTTLSISGFAYMPYLFFLYAAPLSYPLVWQAKRFWENRKQKNVA